VSLTAGLKEHLKSLKMKKSIFTSALLLVVLMGAFSKPSFGKNEIKKSKKTFVLVHGSWLAPFAWDGVAKNLKASGANVVVVELPGHGSDQTPPQNISLDVYREKVVDIINKIDGKVILVGHSFAGMIISEVAETIPAKIEKLVFVGAFVPVNGQTVLALANTDPQSHLGPSLVPSADKLTLDVKKENIVDIFCADSSPETQNLLLEKYRSEPAIPFTNPAVLTDTNFGKVSKYYIHTLQDHVIGMDLQNRMVTAAGITNVYSLESSHTPFLSMPDKLSELLLKISK
jgi:pimeloyl-ACP methyl ester carboxylesterase